MANISAVIIPAKALKGGRHKVRVAVSHNGGYRYIPTDIIIDSEKEFRSGRVVRRNDAALLNAKLRGILDKYQDAIDNLEYIEGLTCSELVELMQSSGQRRGRTLASVFDEYMSFCTGATSTKQLYTIGFNQIAAVVGADSLIQNITHHTILAIDKRFHDAGHKPGTIRNRMTLLSRLLSYARRCGYTGNDPMYGYRIPKAGVRKSWLTVDEVRGVRDYVPCSPGQALAQDMFMLSYYLGGINMQDLKNIDFNSCGDTLSYIRSKTAGRGGSAVAFAIPDEAKEILSRRLGSNGRLDMHRMNRRVNCKNIFAYNFPLIAHALGIDDLVFYSARKSFAQHAFSLGVNAQVIDYILGHKPGSGMAGGSVAASLYSYIAVTPEMATDAVKKVLANLAGR